MAKETGRFLRRRGVGLTVPASLEYFTR